MRTEVKRDNGTPVPVNYTMRGTPQGWKAWDVTIEGISYVKNFRTDFGSEIDAKGLDAVIQRLETENTSSQKPRGSQDVPPRPDDGRAIFAIEQAGPGRLVASGELGFETAAQALSQGDELHPARAGVRDRSGARRIGRQRRCRRAGRLAGVREGARQLARASRESRRRCWRSRGSRTSRTCCSAVEAAGMTGSPLEGRVAAASASASSMASCSSGSIGCLGRVAVMDQVQAALQEGVANESVLVVDPVESRVERQVSGAGVEHAERQRAPPGVADVEPVERLEDALCHDGREVAHRRGPDQGQHQERPGWHAPLAERLAKILVVFGKMRARGHVEHAAPAKRGVDHEAQRVLSRRDELALQHLVDAVLGHVRLLKKFPTPVRNHYGVTFA